MMIADVSRYFHNVPHSVPRTVQSTRGYVNSFNPHRATREIGAAITAILQMRNLGHKEVKQHAQGHRANIVESRAGISTQLPQDHSAFLISLAFSFVQPLLRFQDAILAEQTNGNIKHRLEIYVCYFGTKLGMVDFTTAMLKGKDGVTVILNMHYEPRLSSKGKIFQVCRKGG